MDKTKIQIALSFICLLALSMSATVAKASPIRLDQVVQTVNAKPNKAKTGGFSQLRLSDDPIADDDKTKSPQDKRVIVTENVEIVESETCETEQPPEPKGFPKWALLGLAAIPVAIILIRRDTPTPTPTTTLPPTSTPPTTPTMTPTPEPVPEPMTVLLFGTGLAGIGVAARRRMRRKEDAENPGK